jgi:cell fate regulator YaaT (PSP1 superfamily)
MTVEAIPTPDLSPAAPDSAPPEPQLIEIAFKGNRKEFFLWEGGPELPRTGAPYIVDADRGEDLGRVHTTGDAARTRCARCSHGTGTVLPTRRALRPATRDDVRREADLRTQDEVARRRAMERVKANNLVMKLSDAEWQWDRKKLTFYFTAEKRVDFRTLVRDLAAMFRTRIELKQIGVRDEAKRLDGVGRCGRQYCSASWLPELRPVSLGVAKDQRLSLNPSQISGACGRLMCCLRYEHDFYVQARKRFPKEGKVIVIGRGEEKVLANDIFNETVTVRNADGDTRVVALIDLQRELGRASGNGHDDEPQELTDARFPGEVEMIDVESENEEPRISYRMPTAEMPIPLLEIPPTAPAPTPAAPTGDEEAGGADPQRARRRRGRRGGRRGKRGGGDRGSPPAGA